jgi:outer membrane protein OmpA-like peptidoglycan-associated protein
MKRGIAVAILLGLTLATGCALNPFGGDPVKQAKSMTPQGTPFNQALYRAYLTRAEEKVQLGERDEARYFAGRARMAGDGQAVLPEDLAMDRLGEDSFKALNGAHDQLVRLLVDGGRDHAPEEAAQSQSFFDCWVKAAEAKNAGETSRCQTAFASGISNLQTALNTATSPAQITLAAPSAQGEQPAPSAQPSGTTPGAGRAYKIYFGFDEWHLSAEALTTITEAIDTARKEGQAEIVATGHTDRAGPAPYNLRLSKRRADVVKEVMVQMGARGEAIKVEAYGESRPEVKTADDVKEAKNRRVEINLVP